MNEYLLRKNEMVFWFSKKINEKNDSLLLKETKSMSSVNKFWIRYSKSTNTIKNFLKRCIIKRKRMI